MEKMFLWIHIGWLGETIGDNTVGSYYRNTYGMNKHVGTYRKWLSYKLGKK